MKELINRLKLEPACIIWCLNSAADSIWDKRNGLVDCIMQDCSENEKCVKFADYLLENFIDDETMFSPIMWAGILKHYLVQNPTTIVS